MATRELITKIMELYGCSPQTIAARQAGYRNHSYRITTPDGQILNLILYKREPNITARITRANAISDFLARGGFPTRTAQDRRIVQLRADERVQYVSLYNYLPGQTIPWEAYTQEHLKLLGASMSSMHHALKSFRAGSSRQVLPKVSDEYRLIVARMQRYFSDAGVSMAMQSNLAMTVHPSLLRRYDAVLDICDRLPNPQALHMDFVRGNILFETTNGHLTISGILDFEKTAYGPRVIDISRTLAFLLVDSKFKTHSQVRKYFLQSGYNKRGNSQFRRLRVQTKTHSFDVLEELVDMFLLYDFYKFLRHNPYDSLHENEHFVRTAQLLIERRLVAPVIQTPSIAVPNPKPL
jgi:Ser/Thr protein kinase RdoA (MazF antagonist)